MTLLSLRRKAINYRKCGYSYGMISQKLGLAKSTLSDWLREIPFIPNKKVIKRVGIARMKSAQFQHNLKVANIKAMKELARKELGGVSKRDLWLLGIGLYLGEGSKLYESIRIINSDPQIILLALKWFHDICGLSKENIRLDLHLYPDINPNQAIQFWSRLTGIPRKQFGKIQIDRRTNKSEKKKRKLPYGTAHLVIRSNGRKELGVSLHRRIMGWIDATLEQINKRV